MKRRRMKAYMLIALLRRSMMLPTPWRLLRLSTRLRLERTLEVCRRLLTTLRSSTWMPMRMRMMVWIFDDPKDGDSSMYVHHDIILSTFPLCTAWLDYNIKGGDKGNFLAVGSMDPTIEIWDLDYTSMVYRKDSHINDVLGLAWNKVVRWIGELSTKLIINGMLMRLLKVWHGTQTLITLLLLAKKGIIQSFDIRAASSDTSSCGKPVFTLHAHAKTISSVSYNPSTPNLLAIGSEDNMVKLWNLSNNHPCYVASRNPNAVWDTTSELGMASLFEKHMKLVKHPVEAA